MTEASAQLKALLRTPEATRSETHDLLGCPCLSSSDTASVMNDESDEDVELPPPSFSSAKHVTNEPVSAPSLVVALHVR